MDTGTHWRDYVSQLPGMSDELEMVSRVKKNGTNGKKALKLHLIVTLPECGAVVDGGGAGSSGSAGPSGSGEAPSSQARSVSTAGLSGVSVMK